jgi:hypothetical protein
MVTLKQVYQTTLALGDLQVASAPSPQAVTVVSATGGVVIFQVTPGSSGDIVVMTQNGTVKTVPPCICCGTNCDTANFFTNRGLDLSVLGLNYVLAGGGCVQGEANQCTGNPGGTGMYIVAYNTQNNTYTIVSPSGQYTGNISAVMYDAFFNVVILYTSGLDANHAYLVAIPLNDFTSFITNNQYPASTKWVYIQGDKTALFYRKPAVDFISIIWMVPTNDSNIIYVGNYNINQILQNGNSGAVNSAPTPVTITLNQIASDSNADSLFVVPGLEVVYINNNAYLAVTYPNNKGSFSVTYIQLGTIQGGTPNYTPTEYTFGSYTSTKYPTVNMVKQVAVGVDNSSSTVYFYSLANNNTASTTFNGYFAYVDAKGYLVVLSGQVQNGTTMTIYQICFDSTPVFQNVQITVSSSGVTATGQIVDQCTGSAVSTGTIYLGALYSFDDQSVESISYLASGTPNNGSFNITSSNPPSNVKYYALIYVP